MISRQLHELLWRIAGLHLSGLRSIRCETKTPTCGHDKVQPCRGDPAVVGLAAYGLSLACVRLSRCHG
jgi:hypothetical protein